MYEDLLDTALVGFWHAATHAKASNRWRYHETATNHMIASNRPVELVDILATLA